MARRSRTPQEKKSLSLTRDRRNTYGNNDKAARKAIPRFKAATHRGLRRSVKTELASHDVTGEVLDRKLAEATHRGLHPQKTKGADTPLGKVVAAKKHKRTVRAGGKKRRRDSAVPTATGHMTFSIWDPKP